MSIIKSIQQGAHNIVSNVADDLRENTVTSAIGAAAGGIGGAVKGVKAASKGIHLFTKPNVVKAGLGGAVKGSVAGAFGGNVVADVANKVANIEKAFDNTKIGKAIDNGITKVENGLHKLIGGGSY